MTGEASDGCEVCVRCRTGPGAGWLVHPHIHTHPDLRLGALLGNRIFADGTSYEAICRRASHL